VFNKLVICLVAKPTPLDFWGYGPSGMLVLCDGSIVLFIQYLPFTNYILHLTNIRYSGKLWVTGTVLGHDFWFFDLKSVHDVVFLGLNGVAALFSPHFFVPPFSKKYINFILDCQYATQVS
jgi:hypothetical protein